MIIVKVTYTVKIEFAPKNQINIDAFLEEFKNLDQTAFKYISLVAPDGKTFTHLSMYKDEATQTALLNLPSFLKFQTERDNSILEILPSVEIMQLAGASFEIFQL